MYGGGGGQFVTDVGGGRHGYGHTGGELSEKLDRGNLNSIRKKSEAEIKLDGWESMADVKREKKKGEGGGGRCKRKRAGSRRRETRQRCNNYGAETWKRARWKYYNGKMRSTSPSKKNTSARPNKHFLSCRAHEPLSCVNLVGLFTGRQPFMYNFLN